MSRHRFPLAHPVAIAAVLLLFVNEGNERLQLNWKAVATIRGADDDPPEDTFVEVKIVE